VHNLYPLSARTNTGVKPVLDRDGGQQPVARRRQSARRAKSVLSCLEVKSVFWFWTGSLCRPCTRCAPPTPTTQGVG
jgi:hypothetical protein